MSQEQRNSTTSSNEPTALTQRESGEFPVLLSIDERISQADDFQEIVFLTYARKEIIQQDEEAKKSRTPTFLGKSAGMV
jgi:hypothetical protein